MTEKVRRNLDELSVWVELSCLLGDSGKGFVAWFTMCSEAVRVGPLELLQLNFC